MYFIWMLVAMPIGALLYAVCVIARGERPKLPDHVIPLGKPALDSTTRLGSRHQDKREVQWITSNDDVIFIDLRPENESKSAPFPQTHALSIAPGQLVDLLRWLRRPAASCCTGPPAYALRWCGQCATLPVPLRSMSFHRHQYIRRPPDARHDRTTFIYPAPSSSYGGDSEMNTAWHVLSIGLMEPMHVAYNTYLEHHGCVLVAVPGYRNLYSTATHGDCDVAVLHHSLSPGELMDSAHFVRRRWPEAKVLIIRDDAQCIDDAMYDDRITPGVNSEQLLGAIKRLSGHYDGAALAEQRSIAVTGKR
jgi:hypothetical protein